LHRAVDVDHRHDRNPLEPSLPPAANIDQPLVVAAADRILDFDFCGERAQEQRRIEHLRVDLQLVHML
jgi:hypothetical protein